MAETDDEQEKAKQKRGSVLCNRSFDGSYTQLPNRLLQGEPPLSAQAVRLLVLVASYPSDWDLRPEHTRKVCRLGRDSYYNALDELDQHKLARHIIERHPDGRIKPPRRWEFTLTPGAFQELASGLFLKSRKKPNRLVPENPHEASPDQASPHTTKTDSTKSKKRKKTEQSVGQISSLVVVSVGATAEHISSPPASAPAEGKTDSPREGIPRLWPYPEDADVTKRVKRMCVEPQAVWDKYREQKLSGKADHVRKEPGYLVGMARKMAKEAHGPADPAAMKKARDDLSATYARMNAEEDAEHQRRWKPGGYRGQMYTGKTFKR